MILVLSNKMVHQIAGLLFGLYILQFILPAYPIFKAESINYGFYFAFFIICLYLALIAKLLFHKKKIKFDWVSAFTFYHLINTWVTYQIWNTEVFTSPGGYLKITSPLNFIAFYHLFKSIHDKKFFFFCLTMLMAASVFESYLSVSQAMTGEPQFEHIIYKIEGCEDCVSNESSRNYFAYILPGIAKETVQGTGTFHHFNALGSFLSMCLTISFTLWRLKKSWFNFIIFFIIYFGVICTFSRGALMSNTLAILLVYLMTTNRRYLKIYFLILFFAIFYLLVGSLLKQYAEETGNADVRYDTWSFALKNAWEHPNYLFFGYGTDYLSDVLRSPLVVRKVQYEMIMSMIHSSYIETFIEQGLVGSVLLAIAIITMQVKFLRSGSIWGYCAVGTSFAFLFGQMFEHLFYGFGGNLFFLIMGLIKGYLSGVNDKPTMQEKEPTANI